MIDKLQVIRLVGELIAAVVIPMLAQRNASLAAVVRTFVAAVAEGDHQPTRDAVLDHAHEQGVADHPAVKEVTQ